MTTTSMLGFIGRSVDRTKTFDLIMEKICGSAYAADNDPRFLSIEFWLSNAPSFVAFPSVGTCPVRGVIRRATATATAFPALHVLFTVAANDVQVTLHDAFV